MKFHLEQQEEVYSGEESDDMENVISHFSQKSAELEESILKKVLTSFLGRDLSCDDLVHIETVGSSNEYILMYKYNQVGKIVRDFFRDNIDHLKLKLIFFPVGTY